MLVGAWKWFGSYCGFLVLDSPVCVVGCTRFWAFLLSWVVANLHGWSAGGANHRYVWGFVDSNDMPRKGRCKSDEHRWGRLASDECGMVKVKLLVELQAYLKVCHVAVGRNCKTYMRVDDGGRHELSMARMLAPVL